MSNEGSRLAQVEDAAGALPLFIQAAELYTELVRGAPHDATNQHGLAMALGNQAMLLAVQQRYAEALPVAQGSLEVWDTYVGMRPDDAAAFRQAVVWKTAELLAHQAAEALPDKADVALALGQQEQELVVEYWEQNELLRQSTTLHALELALAEAIFEHVVMRRATENDGSLEDWELILDLLVTRLLARQPQDMSALALRKHLDALQPE